MNLIKNPLVAEIRARLPVDVRELRANYNNSTIYMRCELRTERMPDMDNVGKWTAYEVETRVDHNIQSAILMANLELAQMVINRWRKDHPRYANIIPLRLDVQKYRLQYNGGKAQKTV